MSDRLSYETIVDAIRQSPVTHLPAILAETVRAGHAAGGVWGPGGAKEFVAQVERAGPLYLGLTDDASRRMVEKIEATLELRRQKGSER